MSNLLKSLDPEELKRSMALLRKMREEYPAYPDHDLLIYLLAQALTDVKKRTPLP